MSNVEGFLLGYHGMPSPSSELPKGRSSVERNDPDGHDSSLPVSISDDFTPRKPTRRMTQSHQKLVFCDPVAFHYLEEDPTTVVLDRRRRLEGYELYLVEQWACSRIHPTFVICTYTGEQRHSILVNVLSVPTDKNNWSPRLKIFFQALEQVHARERETPFGTLMTTNLSGFPSNLSVIPVPDGDIRKHREEFIVNEGLKRMGCSGRAALSLQPPQSTTIAKFRHVYRTSDSVPIGPAVLEIVKLCQSALVLYGKLEPIYADGLLCDITEKAIGDWWTDIGTFFHNVEPSDGILGPTTVAALLGLVVGAFNRLRSAGVSTTKDPMDISSMKRGIGTFQRGQRMERTRRLDRETIDRLHKVTDKVARGEGWNVPKAVKSTVAELSGKGGEMVMGIVGAREKAGIAEVETLDIERFGQLVHGPRMKWLWQGKALSTKDLFTFSSDGMNGQRVFSSDDQGNFIWRSEKKDSHSTNELAQEDHHAEGRSGFGRLRDAVGISSLKTHAARLSKEDLHNQEGGTPAEGLTPTTTRQSEDFNRAEHHLRAARTQTNEAPRTPPFAQALAEAPRSAESAKSHPSPLRRTELSKNLPKPTEKLKPLMSPRRQRQQTEIAKIRDEIQSSKYRDFDSEFRYSGPSSTALKRSLSAIQTISYPSDVPRQNRLPRNLSFSLLEKSVLTYQDAIHDYEDGVHVEDAKIPVQLFQQEAELVAAQRQERWIRKLQDGLVPFAEMRVTQVEHLDNDARRHLEELDNHYYQRLEEYQTMRATSSDLVAQEKAGLVESQRRVEMLGQKLDYELTALHSRMQEVEDGVDEFEKNVITIEARVKELIGVDGYGEVPWFQRVLNFLGSQK